MFERGSSMFSRKLQGNRTRIMCGTCISALIGKTTVPLGVSLKMCSRHARHHCTKTVPAQILNLENSKNDGRGGPPWRVMFFGSDNFSIASLKALHECWKDGTIVKTLDVVCPEAMYIKRRKRSRIISPIWQYCHDNDLSTFPWPIKEPVTGYDLGIVSSFGHLVPRHLIDSFPYGIANIHPSILPRWRGASPITHAILTGDGTTGVSIMRIMPNRFDVGPILLQESLDIPARSTTESLQTILANKGAEMLLRVLKDLPTFINNEEVQSEKGVTVCGKITADMSIVDWSKTSTEIDRLYRAIGKQFPLETHWNGAQIRLDQMADPKLTTELQVKVSDCTIGQLNYHSNSQQICVKCKDGWVSFSEVTFKKKMAARDFYNGYLSRINRDCQYFT